MVSWCLLYGWQHRPGSGQGRQFAAPTGSHLSAAGPVHTQGGVQQRVI